MLAHIAQQVDWFLDVLRARPASPSTVTTYRSALRRLQRYAVAHGCTRFEDLSAELVRGAAIWTMDDGARRTASGRSKGNEAMAAVLVTATRSMAAELASKLHMHVPDLREVDVPKVPERIQPRVNAGVWLALEGALAERQTEPTRTLLDQARDRALLHFLSETALRAAEASRLDVGDVDLDTGIVRVWGKGRKPRLVCMRDSLAPDGGEALRYLRVYLDARARVPRLRAQRALWVGPRGRLSPASLRAILRQICDAAGLGRHVAVHAFRRGWFTDLYKADPRDLGVLRARMGWSSRSQELIDTYVRGAELELATVPRPSVVGIWRQGA